MFPPSSARWVGSAASRAWASAEVVVLPFVPVTPIVGAGHRRSTRSGSDTSAGAVGSPAARASRTVTRAARRRGSVVGKSGLTDGDVVTRAMPSMAAAGSTAGPAQQGDRPTFELGDGAAQLVGRAAVVDGHGRTGVDEELRQRDPAPGQPEHRDRTAGQRAVPDGVEGQLVGIDRPLRRRPGCGRWALVIVVMPAS